MELFKGQSLLERKCGHKKYQVRKDLSRTCNICGDTESPTAGTLFHRLKFGLRKAFFIFLSLNSIEKHFVL